jgi:hypothetical protein
MCAAWVQQILADAELNGDSDLAGRILAGVQCTCGEVGGGGGVRMEE